MTDRDKLLQVFDELGVGYWKDYEPTNPYNDKRESLGNDVDVHSFKPNKGYGGFFARFEFDDDGKFVQVGIWE